MKQGTPNITTPSFLVGDKVKNINPSCTHYGSEGTITALHMAKADDDGDDDVSAKVVKADDGDSGDDDASIASVTYQATNSGPNWKPGDSINRACSYLKKM